MVGATRSSKAKRKFVQDLFVLHFNFIVLDFLGGSYASYSSIFTLLYEDSTRSVRSSQISLFTSSKTSHHGLTNKTSM